MPRVSPGWLALREPADASARAPELAELLRDHLTRGDHLTGGHPSGDAGADRSLPHPSPGSAARVVLHDLGSGTGSMARWLAPRLPGPQHWIMYDRDADLLDRAAASISGGGPVFGGGPVSGGGPVADAGPVSGGGPASGSGAVSGEGPVRAGGSARVGSARVGSVLGAVDGEGVTVETRHFDIARLTAADLGGGALGGGADAVHVVTASALLDLLTAEEVERIAAACADAGTPALLTLSVTGRVRLTPPDPLDEQVDEAFNAHQRRTVGGRRLLGPDAVTVAADAFGRHGATVRIRPSPWLLGPDQAELTSEWFTGWLSAAREQRPELIPVTASYGRRRLAEAAAGRLGVEVQHSDLFVQHE